MCCYDVQRPALVFGGDGAWSIWLHACQCWGMFSTAVSADKPLLSALPRWIYFFLDLCLSLFARMFASCFTVNHRGKPGPLPWLVQIISCPLFYFATLPGDKQVLSLVLFVSGMLPNPQLCIPPPLLQRYFVRKGAWSSANPNRDPPVYPLSALTLAGVAFSQGASIWATESFKTHRQGRNC